MKILITGGAGFIGSHASEHFLAQGHRVVAIDNFDPYYPEARKRRNIVEALKNPQYRLVQCDYGDRLVVSKLLQEEGFDVVLHLAAQAGVRPSIENPLKYERNNVGNLIAMLEAMREHGPRKIVAASSSSVYGNNTPAPFREDAPCMLPMSPYGASKRASEIFLGTYCGLYGFAATVVRPFTVYGPRQRPDMAIALFTSKVLAQQTLTVFGDGSTARDYTFVSDIVAGLAAAVEKCSEGIQIYNLGNGKPHTLNELLATVEKATGQKAIIQRKPLQPGDVERTMADITRARADLGYTPQVGLEEGVSRTVAWLKEEQKNGREAARA